jgi:hypothetical protein
MLRWLRNLFFALAFALAGAIAGRIVSNYRTALDAGSAVASARLDQGVLRLRPRDVLPGLIAALRAGEAPWSYLRVPAWLAAFVVNFGFSAFAKELEPLKRMSGFPDLDFFGRGDDEETEAQQGGASPRAAASQPMPAWTAEAASSTSAGERAGNGQQGSGFTAFPN